MIEAWNTKSLAEWEARVGEVEKRVKGVVLLNICLQKLHEIGQKAQEAGFNFHFQEPLRIPLVLDGVDPDLAILNVLDVQRKMGSRIIQRLYVVATGVTDPRKVEAAKTVKDKEGMLMAVPVVDGLVGGAKIAYKGLDCFPQGAIIGNSTVSSVELISFQETGISFEVIKEEKAIIGPISYAPQDKISLKELDEFRLMQARLVLMDIKGMPRTNVRQGLEDKLAGALTPRIF